MPILGFGIRLRVDEVFTQRHNSSYVRGRDAAIKVDLGAGPLRIASIKFLLRQRLCLRQQPLPQSAFGPRANTATRDRFAGAVLQVDRAREPSGSADVGQPPEVQSKFSTVLVELRFRVLPFHPAPRLSSTVTFVLALQKQRRAGSCAFTKLCHYFTSMPIERQKAQDDLSSRFDIRHGRQTPSIFASGNLTDLRKGDVANNFARRRFCAGLSLAAFNR